MAKMQHQKNTR